MKATAVALKAKFSGVYCLAFTQNGDKLYITDLENRRIRVLDIKTGQVDLIAGNGQKGVPKDGATAKDAPLVDPRACAVDKKGNIYILERSGHALRVVDPAGKNPHRRRRPAARRAFPAMAATPSWPLSMAQAPLHGRRRQRHHRDSGNHVIRKYLPASGAIARVAGSGKKGASGSGGDPLAITFNEPHGVFVQPTAISRDPEDACCAMDEKCAVRVHEDAVRLIERDRKRITAAAGGALFARAGDAGDGAAGGEVLANDVIAAIGDDDVAVDVHAEVLGAIESGQEASPPSPERPALRWRRRRCGFCRRGRRRAGRGRCVRGM